MACKKSHRSKKLSHRSYQRNNTNSALIYLRVSTRRQASDGHFSLDVQREKCEEYANKHDLIVGHIMVHVGSAYSCDNLQTVYRKMRREGFTHLIIYHASRFSRKTQRGLTYLHKYPDIIVHSVTDEIQTNSITADHAFRLALSNAELESDNISQRTRAASLRNCFTKDYGIVLKAAGLMFLWFYGSIVLWFRVVLLP